MEESLKFNSQVCTNIKQSQRLLDLGLKPETADMYHTAFYRDNVRYEIIQVRNMKLPLLSQYIPAWSLHRLLEMICNKECEEHYYFDFSMDYDSMADVYDSIIEVIERHIKDNFINKESLKL